MDGRTCLTSTSECPTMMQEPSLMRAVSMSVLHECTGMHFSYRAGDNLP